MAILLEFDPYLYRFAGFISFYSLNLSVSIEQSKIFCYGENNWLHQSQDFANVLSLGYSTDLSSLSPQYNGDFNLNCGKRCVLLLVNMFLSQSSVTPNWSTCGKFFIEGQSKLFIIFEKIVKYFVSAGHQLSLFPKTHAQFNTIQKWFFIIYADALME